MPPSQKAFPHVFLGEYYFKELNYAKACEHYTQAWLFGVDFKFDIQKIASSFLSVYLAQFAATPPEQPTLVASTTQFKSPRGPPAPVPVLQSSHHRSA